jgi:hypothetical protein
MGFSPIKMNMGASQLWKNLRSAASCLRYIYETGETPVLRIDLQWDAPDEHCPSPKFALSS